MLEPVDKGAALRSTDFHPADTTVLQEPEVQYEGTKYRLESLVVVAQMA